VAKFRQVHTTFWNDAFVLDLTPEEKYFYLYLMTNDKTTQCGIYELPKRVIEMHTGYNRETVDKLLGRFIDYGKVLYQDSTKEIMLTNWAKYNFINSPKVKKCIEKELEAVKNKQFTNLYLSTLSKYGYGIDTVSIDLGEEEEKEEEEEEEQQQQEIHAADFFQQNFGILNPFVGQQIGQWVDDLSSELVIEAMKRALANQKKWSYAEGILKTWANQNVATLEDVQALDADFNRNKEGQHGKKHSGHYGSLTRTNGKQYGYDLPAVDWDQR
jgi:DnaD/phage-associated family protein